MKTFRVWTHEEVTPLEVQAASRNEALAKGLEIVKQSPPVIPARDVAAWYCDENGKPVESHFYPARTPKALDEPFARVKPKPSTFRRF